MTIDTSYISYWPDENGALKPIKTFKQHEMDAHPANTDNHPNLLFHRWNFALDKESIG